MKKVDLVAQLEARLEAELASLKLSTQAAVEAATNEDSKPENKYDTRGLEASYLAGAQAERVSEIQGALASLKSMVVKNFAEDDKIGVSALVEVDAGESPLLCFLVRHGAGYDLRYDARPVVTVTTSSPLGKGLLGKARGDVVTVITSQGDKDYDILAVE